MKSKSNTFILGIVILVVVGALIYFFGFRGNTGQAADAGLVSTNTGNAAGLASATSGSGSAAGEQVVVLLRNLSAIKLDDAVFRNPSFVLLQDTSVQLPPITNQGRRNPFASVGVDANAPSLVPVTSAATAQ